jgi:hypothetical protein
MTFRFAIAAFALLAPPAAACPVRPANAPLTSYYACDEAARQTILGQEEAARCNAVYGAVKVAFGGYDAFKEWERCAPDVAAKLRPSFPGRPIARPRPAAGG